MKYMLFFIFLRLLIIPIFTPKSLSAKGFQLAAVAFYNCENLFDTLDNRRTFDEEFTPTGARHYTSEVYHDKIDKLSRVLAEIARDKTPDGAAVIGLAEIENIRVLNDLVMNRNLQSRMYQYVHFDSPDPRGIDVALLYHPKYFYVLHAQALSVELPLQDKKRTRDILWVQGIFAKTDTIHFLVAHFPSRLGGEEASAPLRAAAANVAKRIMDSLQINHPRQKIIFMGDLNDNPTDASVAVHLRAKGKRESLGAQDRYNPWVAWYKKGLGTLAYQDVWSLFDQIILSPNFLLSPAHTPHHTNGFYFHKSYIFNPSYLIEPKGKFHGYPKRSYVANRYNGGYSDHFPVYITLLRALP